MERTNKTTEQPSQKMRGEPTTGELQALAARQQQQLDTQARLIAAREHRLRQVKKFFETKNKMLLPRIPSETILYFRVCVRMS